MTPITVFQPIYEDKFHKTSFTKSRLDDDSKKFLRGWQKEADKLRNDNKYTLTNVLMGGGKTIYSQHMGLCLQAKSPKIKLVYIVPQTHIGVGFGQECEINGRLWSVDKFLCEGEGTNGRQFVEFFQDYVGGILVCTHSTLVKNWERIKTEINENLHIFVDEAHHISGQEDDENKVGEFCRFALDNGAGLHLMTATFFRGDKSPIIPPQFESLFHKYSLPIDEYISKYVRSFKSFDYQFAFAVDPEHGLYAKQVGKMLRNETKKTLIFIPNVNSNWVDDKHRDVRNIISGIIGRKIHKLKEDADGVIRIDGHSFINLVEENNREIKKRTMGDGKNLNVDFIIALGMFKEGSNWTHAEKAVICGPRNSLVETIQIVGRPLRDVDEGCKEPEIIQILAKPSRKIANGELKDWVNDNLCYISVSLLMELAFDTPKLKKDDVKTAQAKSLLSNKPTNGNFIAGAAGGSDEKTQELMRSFCEIHINTDSKEEFIEKATEFVKDNYGEDFAELAATQYWKISERRDALFSKRNIKEVSDHVNMVDGESGTWMVGVFGEVGLRKMEEIRTVLEYGYGSNKSYQDHITEAKKYKNENSWARKTPEGYFSSVTCRNKGWLKDMFPKNEKASLGEHIELAKQLGIESCSKWAKSKNIPENYYRNIYESQKNWIQLIWPDYRKIGCLDSQALLSEYKKNPSIKELAKKHNYSVDNIRRILKKEGIKFNVSSYYPYKKLKQILKQESVRNVITYRKHLKILRELYDTETVKVPSPAERTLKSIYPEWIGWDDLFDNPKRNKKEVILKLRQEGLSLTEIHRISKISSFTIGKICRVNNS